MVHNLPAVAALLADTRVDPSLDDNFALELAVWVNDPSIVEALLACPRTAMTPASLAFGSAVRAGKVECVAAFLRHPAAVSQAQYDAAFTHALSVQDPGLIQTLLYGSQYRIPTQDQLNALTEAAVHFDSPALLATALPLLEVHAGVPLQTIFTDACRGGKPEIVKYMMNLPQIDPAADNNAAFHAASTAPRTIGVVDVVSLLMKVPAVSTLALVSCIREGNVDGVRSLLRWPVVDPTASNNIAVRTAAEAGNPYIMRALLDDPRTDPSALDNQAILAAANNLNLAMVRELMRHNATDPSVLDNQPLALAATAGRTDIVAQLLKDKRVDPSSRGNHAVQTAIAAGNLPMVKILVKDPRTNPFAESFAFLRAVGDNGTRDHAAVVEYLLERFLIHPPPTLFGEVHRLSPEIARVWRPYLLWRPLRAAWSGAVARAIRGRFFREVVEDDDEDDYDGDDDDLAPSRKRQTK
jgi:hypothetical protein